MDAFECIGRVDQAANLWRKAKNGSTWVQARRQGGGDGRKFDTHGLRSKASRAATPSPFQACVLRYWQGFQTLIMQSTACMALHPVQERCCRWLLMAHDRVRQDEFQLSPEFLAMMLGSTCRIVTVVAGTLQKAGLIHYRDGHMTILDRKSLEDASCECYATVKDQFDRLGL